LTDFAARAFQEASTLSSPTRLRHLCRADTSIEEIKARARLRRYYFFRRSYEIGIEWPRNIVEPGPVVRKWLENQGCAMAPNPHFIRIEPKFFRQTNCLRPAGPQNLGSYHHSSKSMLVYLKSLLHEKHAWQSLVHGSKREVMVIRPFARLQLVGVDAPLDAGRGVSRERGRNRVR
jgi:hypothetical protein